MSRAAAELQGFFLFYLFMASLDSKLHAPCLGRFFVYEARQGNESVKMEFHAMSESEVAIYGKKRKDIC